MNGLKAKKGIQLQTSLSLKIYSVAYCIYNFMLLFFFIKEQEQTGRDWFKILSKTTWLSCLVK